MQRVFNILKCGERSEDTHNLTIFNVRVIQMIEKMWRKVLKCLDIF